MATSQSINSIVRTLRQRADQIGSSTFDDATELKPWVRDSLAQLYEIMCQRQTDWYTVSVPVSLLADVEAYQLPSDFKSINSLFALYNGGQSRQKLREFRVDDFGAGNAPIYQNSALSYRVIRNLLYLQPLPNRDSFNALELSYTPQYRGPLLDYTACDSVMPEGYTEWVVLDVLQKMNIKTRLQNMDDILKSKSQIESRILSSASMRSDYAPVMRDGMRRSYGPSQYGYPAGPAFWASA